MAYKTQEEYDKLDNLLAEQYGVNRSMISLIRALYYDPYHALKDKELITVKLGTKQRKHWIACYKWLKSITKSDFDTIVKQYE